MLCWFHEYARGFFVFDFYGLFGYTVTYIYTSRHDQFELAGESMQMDAYIVVLFPPLDRIKC